MKAEIHGFNKQDVIRMANSLYACERFKVEISDSRPENIKPFIFDGERFGNYMCYIPEYSDVVFLTIYPGTLSGMKILVKCSVQQFGQKEFEAAVCEKVEEAKGEGPNRPGIGD